MCIGPEMAIALALTGAGKAVSTMEQNRSLKSQQRAKDAALQTELGRQKGFQADADAAFQDTLGAFKKPQQDQTIGDLIFKNTEALQKNQAPAAETDYAPATNNAPKVVQSSLAETIADAVGKGAESASKLAKLRSTGDQMFGNSVKLQKGSTKIGTIGNFAGNSANINQAEQREAYQNAAKAPSGIGDLLQLAGTAAGLDAGTGGTMANRAGVWLDTGANIFPKALPPGMYGPPVPSLFG